MGTHCKDSYMNVLCMVMQGEKRVEEGQVADQDVITE